MKTTRSRRNRRGFTIIEISFVLVIIGILASLAVYTYKRFADKARMTQAQTTLMHLQKTETIYFTEHERYSDNLAILDFDPAKYNYYTISIVLDNNESNYTGIATGVDVMAGDAWTIQREGPPVQDNASTFR
jgi:type IV pilus assembly protein PilE